MRALITGGQQGIGYGIAKALHSAGFDIAIASEAEESADTVKEALSTLKGARYYRHDLREIETVSALLDAVKQDGPLTTFVSNAGIGAPVRGDMLDLEPDNFDLVMGINLRGAFFLAQEVASRMLTCESDDYRSVHFVTSVSATMASPERAEYCMSKSAAAMMAQLFALRLAPHGIGVYDLRPGIISTPLTAAVADKYTARIKGGLVPALRWGTPEDIGQTIVPLATGQMRFATGAAIAVDGGLSIERL